eukprot:Lithocolla_globosa_v1_NODE_449_length_4005_cov_11.872152.p2 type:complete len:323 gc:universal NODE_449_length_4005_cov_11.872152:590-1558(+)
MDSEEEAPESLQFVDQDQSVESFLPFLEEAIGWHAEASDTKDDALLYCVGCNTLISSQWRHLIHHLAGHNYVPDLGSEKVKAIKTELKCRRDRADRRRSEAKPYPQKAFSGVAIKSMFKCDQTLFPFICSTITGMKSHLRENHRNQGSWSEASGQRWADKPIVWVQQQCEDGVGNLPTTEEVNDLPSTESFLKSLSAVFTSQNEFDRDNAPHPKVLTALYLFTNNDEREPQTLAEYRSLFLVPQSLEEDQSKFLQTITETVIAVGKTCDVEDEEAVMSDISVHHEPFSRKDTKSTSSLHLGNLVKFAKKVMKIFKNSHLELC